MLCRCVPLERTTPSHPQSSWGYLSKASQRLSGDHWALARNSLSEWATVRWPVPSELTTSKLEPGELSRVASALKATCFPSGDHMGPVIRPGPLASRTLSEPSRRVL